MAIQRSNPLDHDRILKLKIRHLMDLKKQIERHVFCCSSEPPKGLLDLYLVTPTCN